MRAWLSSVVVVASVLGLVGDAGAYCRSTTCGNKESCQKDADGCNVTGAPLFWETRCVGVRLDARGVSTLPFADVSRALDAALETWSTVSCGGKPASIAYGRLPDIDCFDPGKAPPELDLITFREGDWPYVGAENALAFTTTSFDPKTGAIRGIHMDLNAAQRVFTVASTTQAYDLQSVLTHELGHALGLAHSSVPDATMYFSYPGGNTLLRDLDPDDVAAVCDAYPPSRVAACDTTPKNAAAAACEAPAAADPPSGCSVGAGDPARAPTSLALALSCALFGCRSRRSRKATKHAC